MMPKISEKQANSSIRAADRLHDLGIIDVYTYEKIMTEIRHQEEERGS